MTAEHVLMTLLVGGIAVGCVLVLYPFFSSLLWAAILVFTTWPVCEWLHTYARLRRGPAAGVMVALTAVVLVLPLALAVPGGANDVNHLRGAIEDALRAGLPGSPDWVFDIALIGPTLGNLWNHWAADISAMLEALRPYFGIVLEGGLGLLLGLANGVLLFVLALFIAFFFYLYGDPIAERLRVILQRIAGARAERLIDVTGATVRGVVYGILLTAIVQGILTAFGLWLSGVPRPVLLGAVAGFLAVLPIGAPLVWIPAALWLMGSGHLGWGVFLAV
jgi:predicted PurR-regulated permease PerM